jgi:hypothetical protein
MTGPAESRTSEPVRGGPAEQPAAASFAPAPPARGALPPRVPDFFIVGHAKCGTTALHQLLRQHPQIHIPLKEPRFFAMELRSRFRRLGPERLPVTLDEYLALFDGARPGQVLGEASPQYLRSSQAAQRIARVRPDARIIAILREPAAFVRSFHMQALHNHNESATDLARALALEPARREGRRVPLFAQSPAALMYSEHVRYVAQLRRFHEAFGHDNVLVLIYDDFLADNDGTLRRVLRFLDVDADVSIEPVRTSPLTAIRSPRLYLLNDALAAARRKVGLGRGADRAERPPHDGATAWQRLLYAPPPPSDEQVMTQMRRRFKPEVIAISEYLGRDLVAEWGYDRLG